MTVTARCSRSDPQVGGFGVVVTRIISSPSSASARNARGIPTTESTSDSSRSTGQASEPAGRPHSAPERWATGLKGFLHLDLWNTRTGHNRDRFALKNETVAAGGQTETIR